MLGISKRTQGIKPSFILSLNAQVKAMKAKGESIADFVAGEPDFNTPDNVKNAAKRALDENYTRYINTQGMPELRQAIADKLLNQNGLDYLSSQITVCNGAKGALYNTFEALLNEGDEAIVLAPYWSSYTEMIRLAGGTPVIVPTTLEFEPDIEAIRNAITPKTKFILLNSPNNPTGAVYGISSLQKLATLVVEKDLYVVSDEIYEKLVYEGRHSAFGSVSPDVFNRTITIGGFSKSFAMTGWRLGYAAAPPEIAQAIAVIQSNSGSNVSSITQKAGLAALKEPAPGTDAMKNAFAERRTFVVKELQDAGFDIVAPKGAFYAFFSVKKFLDAKHGNTPREFCTKLLEEKKVALVPGEEFGSNEHVRLSYAASLHELREGLTRLREFVK